MRFILLFFILFSFAKAQDKYCGSSEKDSILIANHPEILTKRNESKLQRENYLRSAAKKEGQVYIIPVVFHILHNYGAENISDAQVIDAVRVLNEDFSKRNPDISEVIAPFQSVAADCEIEFRLANKDPNGNCTNGIDRIATTLTYRANDDAKLNQWPPNKYLNIWVVQSTDREGVAGYAYFPEAANWNPQIDGIVILHNYVGSMGTSEPRSSRALTHEVGHYLDLPHTWGYNNSPGVSCGDDDVNDTPETKGWRTCNLNGSQCATNIIENVQNYMDYSYCSKMFTTGQKDRMRAALNSGIADRNNLWSTSNLVATGTNTQTPNVCSPIADFSANTPLICAGASINFSDFSWNGAPTQWSWNFEGGTPSSSSLANPAINYNEPGVYQVTLTASNATGNSTRTKSQYIKVLPANAKYTYQFMEDFENTFPGQDWIIKSTENTVEWEINNRSFSGIQSISLNNENNLIGEVDELISPTINLSTITNYNLTFKLAFAQIDEFNNDKLEVLVSNNCGLSWYSRYNKNGSELATAEATYSSFLPSAEDWREERVNLSYFAPETNIMLKFKFTSGGGNNIYIDNIQLFDPLSVTDVNNDFPINLFPVPSSEYVDIAIPATQSENTLITVFDLLGNKVREEKIAATEKHRLYVSNFSAGVYYLQVQSGNNGTTKKIIVNKQ